jgi:hypothetical protein
LAESAAEEARVHANYEAELAIFDNSMAAARSAANAQIERLRNLPVPSSDVGSDIVGAWLVAGQNLASVRADFELVLAQSDLRDFGPASQGVLRISGVHAVILNWDVDDATEAERLEKFWAAKLREAGAASVRFLTPAQTAVADLLEGM